MVRADSREKEPVRRKDGGGGNRTRVRGRTGASVYKLRSRLGFRPDGWFATDLPPG
jgi:hypothetical protein